MDEDDRIKKNITGFVLVDSKFNEGNKTASSFELVFTAGDVITALAGYKTDNSYFTESGLVYTDMSFKEYLGHMTYLHTKTQTANIFTETVYTFPVTLTMKGINTAGQSPAPAACGGFPQQSCGVLNPSFPHSLNYARVCVAYAGAISLRSSINNDGTYLFETAVMQDTDNIYLYTSKP